MRDFGPFSRIGGLWRSNNRASGRLRSMAAHSTPFAAPYRALEPLRGAASRIGGPLRRDGTDPHVRAIAPSTRAARSPWSPALV